MCKEQMPAGDDGDDHHEEEGSHYREFDDGRAAFRSFFNNALLHFRKPVWAKALLHVACFGARFQREIESRVVCSRLGRNIPNSWRIVIVLNFYPEVLNRSGG